MTDTPTGSRPSAPPRARPGRRLLIGLVGLSYLLLFVIWDTRSAFHDQLAHEQALAIRAAGAAAQTIGAYLQSVRTDLATLSNQEQDLLTGLVVNPDAGELSNSLRILLQMLFPNILSFAILDPNGDIGTIMGASIDVDTRRYVQQHARGLATPVRISGLAEDYRLDFLVPLFSHGLHDGHILLSLRCAQLCSELLENAPLGHRFALRPAGDALHGSNEVADAASNTPAAEYPTPQALWAHAQIPGADWILVARVEGKHLLGGMRSALLEAILRFGGFSLIALLLYYWAATRRARLACPPRPAPSQEQQLRAVVNGCSEAMVLTDDRGTIEVFNPAAETLFGRSGAGAIGSRVDRFIPSFFSKDLAGRFSDPAARDRSDGSPVIRETFAVRDRSPEFPVRLSLRPLQIDHTSHFLLLTQDLTRTRQHQARLAFLEQRDVLTGLLNRRQFERRLEAVLSLSELPEPGHVLGVVDVGQFKAINDACGQEAGDNLLEQLAVLIQSQLPATETLGRLGNDEFGILFNDCSVAEANQICSILRHAVRNFVFHWGDRSFDVSVSIGLVGIDTECESTAQIMSQADIACHVAKTHGRNRIHVYRRGDTELVRRQGDVHMVPSISNAISEDRFLLIAQPIMPIAAGKSATPHFEILVRMLDEHGNTVIPGEFVPAAERYTLMPAVDRWVVNRLFARQQKNLQAWVREHGDSFLFAVNLSATSLMDHGFLGYLKRQFIQWDVPYTSICFEITETAAISRLDQAKRFIEELKSAGCSFALDDFGTGLSSYTYLKELAVDYLKIDGSFVRNMADDPVDHAMVDSINQIGHTLGLETIAEWAENHHTLNQLRALNVDYAQGFGVGKIIALDDFELGDIPPAVPLQTSKRNDRLAKLPQPGLRPA